MSACVGEALRLGAVRAAEQTVVNHAARGTPCSADTKPDTGAWSRSVGA